MRPQLLSKAVNYAHYAKGLTRKVKERRRYREIYAKYRAHTMVPESWYVATLELCDSVRNVEGCVVECGVWRGGMSAGIAELLGSSREYLLFDSFEGLPRAEEIDGPEIGAWQADTASPWHYNNCSASETEADGAMKMAAAQRYKLIKGWFQDTVPGFSAPAPIAILCLDADLYQSTKICLKSLYPQLARGGLVILDDYDVWEGCARAVHDFLSTLSSAGPTSGYPRIRQHRSVFYLA